MNARTLIEDDDLKSEMLTADNWWVFCNKPGGMIYVGKRPTGELYWVGKPEKAADLTHAEAVAFTSNLHHINGAAVHMAPAPE